MREISALSSTVMRRNAARRASRGFEIPEPPRTYGAQSGWNDPFGWATGRGRAVGGRDAHLTAARPIVREFGFLRLPKRSRRARLHDRVRESASYARGETSQAESPDAHGPLEAQKIFPLVWQFVVHLVHDTILSSRALRFSYGAQSQKTGLEKAAKTHCYVTSAEGRRDNETRGGRFPPRMPLGNSRKFP